MRKTSIAFALACTLPVVVHAFNLSCVFSSECVETQGTKIPIDDVVEMMDNCNTLKRGGQRALSMSFEEVMRVAGGNVEHPWVRAQFAYRYLYESPLDFSRKRGSAASKYHQVVGACNQLSIDHSRWQSGG